jgi:hypothetical protein
MHSIRELQPNEQDKWNTLLANSPQGTIFHRLEWNEMLTETDPHIKGILPLVCVDKNKEFLAAIITPYHSASHGLRVDSPFGYSTPLFSKLLNEGGNQHMYTAHTIHADLLRSLSEHIPNICLHNAPDIWDIRAYSFLGWQIDTVHTHEIPRTENNWEKIDQDLRTTIQQGEEKYSLHTEVNKTWDELFVKKTNHLHPNVLGKRLDWLRQTGTGRLFTLTDRNNIPIAFTLAILSQPDGRAYLWGTTIPKTRGESDALPVLLWQTCINLLRDFQRVDLGTSPNIGISQIKDKLGAKLLPTFVTKFNKRSKARPTLDSGND